jgi:hypothetical protein
MEDHTVVSRGRKLPIPMLKVIASTCLGPSSSIRIPIGLGLLDRILASRKLCARCVSCRQRTGGSERASSVTIAERGKAREATRRCIG